MALYLAKILFFDDEDKEDTNIRIIEMEIADALAEYGFTLRKISTKEVEFTKKLEGGN